MFFAYQTAEIGIIFRVYDEMSKGQITGRIILDISK